MVASTMAGGATLYRVDAITGTGVASNRLPMPPGEVASSAYYPFDADSGAWIVANGSLAWIDRDLRGARGAWDLRGITQVRISPNGDIYTGGGAGVFRIRIPRDLLFADGFGQDE
jgi:hypothetical protein